MIIPLRSVNVTSQILDGMAEVVTTFVFQNTSNIVINPIHYFSLFNATINDVTMQIGNKFFTSTVKEKNAAKKEYTDAVKSGHKANIIEPLSDNDYKLSLGNVEPGEIVYTIVKYTTFLECNYNGAYVFTFPTNISIKYKSQSNDKIDNDYAEEMSNIAYSDEIPYEYTFEIVWTSNKINGVEACTDICEINLSEDETKLIVRSKGFPMRGDFTVSVKTDSKPTVYYYEHSSDEIYTLLNTRVDLPASTTVPSKKNWQIVLDCSGSMWQMFGLSTKIEVTKDTIINFLKKLPKDHIFNITLFGSEYRILYDVDMVVTDDNINDAILKIKNINSDLGGTELYNCLRNTMMQETVICEKIIVLLTDGQIYNYHSLTSLFKTYNDLSKDVVRLKSNIPGAQPDGDRFRVFTVGIGNDVDRKLIKKLADVTGGLYIHAKDTPKMSLALDYIINNINGRYYTDARLHEEEKDGITIYPNKNYVFLQKLTDLSTDICLHCINAKTNTPTKITVRPDKFIKKGLEIKRLFDNLNIKNLEHSIEFEDLTSREKSNKIDEVVNLSIQSNIMSKYTAFLIVVDNNPVHQIGKDVVVPHYSEKNTKSGNSVEYCDYSCCEEVDCLEGGMDMFGGGSSGYYVGIKGFVPYVTKIGHETIDSRFTNLMRISYTDVCFRNDEDFSKFAGNLNPILVCNIILFFQLKKEFQLDFLYAIVQAFNEVTFFQMIKIDIKYQEYIMFLESENSRCEYRYIPGSDY